MNASLGAGGLDLMSVAYDAVGGVAGVYLASKVVGAGGIQGGPMAVAAAGALGNLLDQTLLGSWESSLANTLTSWEQKVFSVIKVQPDPSGPIAMVEQAIAGATTLIVEGLAVASVAVGAVSLPIGGARLGMDLSKVMERPGVFAACAIGTALAGSLVRTVLMQPKLAPAKQ